MASNQSAHPKDLLADYALGILEPEELNLVETHLATCERCQQELNEFDTVLVSWAETLPEMTPSPQVWSKLQARLANESESVDAGLEPELKDDDLLPEIAQPDVQTKVPTPEDIWIPTSPTVYRRPVTPWLAAAACLLLAFGASLWGWRSEQRYQVARADEQLISQYLTQADVTRVSLFDEQDAVIGAILVADEDAVFVMENDPARSKVYQAWGHTSDDWIPDSGELLDSLGTSPDGVFKVSTAGFSGLYLSLEPPGGSPQPTKALTKVSLFTLAAEVPIVISSPENGATLTTNSTIVRGELSNAARSLSYRLNDGEEVVTNLTGTRFLFTVTSLQAGENKLEIIVSLADGTMASEELTLNYQP